MSISVAKHTSIKSTRLKKTIIIRSKLKFNKKHQQLLIPIKTMLKSLNNNPNNPSAQHHHYHHYNNHNPAQQQQQHRAYTTPYSYHNRQQQQQLQQEPSFNRQPQPSNRNFNPNRFKKSKSIKIGTSASSSTNNSRFTNSHSFNNSSMPMPFQPQFGAASLLEQFNSNQTPVATMAAVAAAATLANLLRSDGQTYAPISTNHNNNNNKNSQYYSNLNKFNSHCNPKFKFKPKSTKARFLNFPFKVSHNGGVQYQRTNSFNNSNNRSKHFFNNKSGNFSNNGLATGGLNLATKNNAPYNTTQYIMYDYSKRRSLKEQECPNEQQQFSDDWNNALAQQGSSMLCPLNLESIILNNRKLNEQSSLKFMSKSESDNLNRIISNSEESGGEAMETSSSEAPDQINSNSNSVGLLLSSSL